MVDEGGGSTPSVSDTSREQLPVGVRDATHTHAVEGRVRRN